MSHEARPVTVAGQAAHRHGEVAPPRLPHLYTHALESIFAFLPLADLATILAVSRSWSAAVASMRPINATVSASRLRSSPVSLVAALLSGLARHLGTLGSPAAKPSSDGEVQLDGQAVALLPRLAHLHTLICHFSKKVLQSRQEAIVFPPKLTRLTLSTEKGSSTVQIDAALLAASRLPLLRCFELRLGAADPAVSFAPFTSDSAPQLASFGFLWPNSSSRSPSDQQLDAVCAMVPHLTALQLGAHTSLLLPKCFREPQPPSFTANLRSLGERLKIDTTLCSLLPSLPSLTELAGWMMADADPLVCLPRLPNLTQLRLYLHFYHANAQDPNSNDRLKAALFECVGLTSLQLFLCALTSDDVYALLQRMPHLRDLDLPSATRLTSLRCFSTPPLCLSLQRLSVRFAYGQSLRPSSELAHLHALRGLTHLDVRHAFSDQLSEDAISSLRPPSNILTNLKQFEYKLC